ncbi:kelch-like protein 5 [Glossina fuscipes]|uniref:Kelch-like protein diablo n=1 Tax=Glossina fuscipes TaxID=7396 RepID=A0A9C6E023_9MUSC|nr:kelch-like protein 5 [Glossina fuscipes]
MATGNVSNVEIVEKCENRDYSSDFFHVLNTMRVGRKFCDFSLNVDGEVIHVHKLVLAIASPYFAAIFEDDMKEKTKTFLKLNDADLIAVKALVKYIYSGMIILTKDNVEQLLRTSDLFQIEWVKQQCIRFLKQSLSSTNCFRIRKFADMQSCKELYDFSHKYIIEHFNDLLEQDDLLLLPFEQIRELIKDEQPRSDIENAYKVSMNWIKHDPDQRKEHLAELISLIRLPLASSQFLTAHVVTERLLRDDHKCNEFLIEALSIQLTKANAREAQNFQVTKVDEPKCLCKTQTEERKETFYVFLVGGSNVDRMCKVYDVSRNIVVPIPNMSKKRCKNGAISLDGAIFAIGGHTGTEIKAAECYDPIKKQWHDITPTNHGHWDFGICTHNDRVYVVGGEKNSTVECYCNATNKWYPCQSMSTKGHISTRAALAENSIYTLNYEHDGSTSCMRFDPREGGWHKLNKLEMTAYDFELIAHDHTLFAIGSDRSKRLDIRTNRWELMPSMSYNRHGFSAIINADDIYVLGGRGKSKFTKFPERYNIRQNKWTIINTVEMEHYLGGAAIISAYIRLN